MRTSYLPVGLGLLLASCASVPEGSSDALSPAQLNSSKREYHGKHVRVQGWMRAETENYGLWQSEDANSQGSFARKCVSLMIPESMKTSAFNKSYVEVEGVFLERLPSNVVHLGGCNTTTLQLLEGAPPVRIRKPISADN